MQAYPIRRPRPTYSLGPTHINTLCLISINGDCRGHKLEGPNKL